MRRIWTVAVALSLGLLGGCALRLDLPPGPLPSPNTQQAALIALAGQLKALEQGADSLVQQKDLTPLSTVISQCAAFAGQSAQALGGSWQPWPNGVPSGAPTVPAPIPIAAGLNGYVQALELAHADAANALGSSDEANARRALILVILGTEHWSALLRHQAGLNGLVLPESSSPPLLDQSAAREDTSDDSAPAQDFSPQQRHSLGQSVAGLDYARYLLETSLLSVRAEPWEIRAQSVDQLSYQASELVRLGAPDTRQGQRPVLSPRPSDSELQRAAWNLAADSQIVALTIMDNPQKSYWLAQLRTSMGQILMLGGDAQDFLRSLGNLSAGS